LNQILRFNWSHYSFLVQEASLNIFHTGTTIVDGNLCIIVADARCVLTVPNSLLPRDDNPECPPISMFRFEDNLIDNSRDDVSFMSILTANSPYGVFAMSLDIASVENAAALDVTFWIRTESTPGEGRHLITSESMPGSLSVTAVDDIDLSQWENVVQALSGRRGLVLLNMQNEVDYDSQGTQVLRLVSCQSHTHVTFRDLVLPDSIDLFKVHGLFLDDHLGIVSMIDSTGLLYVIPYA
jgi:hypothetical protein